MKMSTISNTDRWIERLEKLARSPKWVTICLIVLLTSCVLAVFFAILPESYRINESTDFTSAYLPSAKSLIQGDGYTIDGNPVTRYPPGYSIILAGILGFAQLFDISDGTILLNFTFLGMALGGIALFQLGAGVWGY